VELLRLLRVVRRRWPVIVLVALVGAGIGVASAEVGSKATVRGTYYRATDTLTSDRNALTSDSAQGFTSLSQIALLSSAGNVPKNVAQKLGLDVPTLIQQVTLTTNNVLGTIAITAISTDAAEATRIASTFGDELISNLNALIQKSYDTKTQQLFAQRQSLLTTEQQLDAQLATPLAPGQAEVIRDERDAVADQLRLTLSQIQAHASTPVPAAILAPLASPDAVQIGRDDYDTLLALGKSGPNVSVVDASSQQNSATTTGASTDHLSGPVARGILGGLLGLLVGLGLAFLLESLDRRIRTREELEAAYGAPLLAEVPRLGRDEKRVPRITSLVSPFSRTAEAHRAVRSAILFEVDARRAAREAEGGSKAATGEGIVVMLTSATQREGKTTTAANLAVVFAEAGATVLVVNCDFRRPELHRYFGVEDTPGRVLDTAVPGLKVAMGADAGPHARPAQVIDAQRQLISAARRNFDIVLLDTAPLLATNDATDVAAAADLVVVVAQYVVSKQHSARRAAELLERLRAPIGGVVFVAAPAVSEDTYYYYYSRSAPDRRADDDGVTSILGDPKVAETTIPETTATETTVVLAESASEGASNAMPNGSNGSSATRGNGATSTASSPSPDEPPALRWND
jgi:Mrp family chromosome partitioning ATPase/capsular polysaccharide biosynthesis protein